MIIFPTVDSYHFIVENVLKSLPIKYETSAVDNIFILKNEIITYFYFGKIYIYDYMIDESFCITTSLKGLLNFLENGVF